MRFTAELHLHSCLSPDTQFHMHPEQIVKALLNRHVGLSCLCDLNCALNIPAFAIHAKRHSLPALYGSEVICSEGAAVLCMFSDPLCAVEFGAEWMLHLPEKEAPEGTVQAYVDEEGNIMGCVKKNLFSKADVSIYDLEREVHRNGGLVVPAAVDGAKNSLMSAFGRIIEGKWDALEFLHPENAEALLSSPYPVIAFSKPEYLDYVGEFCPEFDSGNLSLLEPDGSVSLEAVTLAFARHQVPA